jgi:diadenosine tetraphosphate (Ap4A) HIT family hydrolase
MRSFTLHPQLARDTTFVGDLALSRVLLMNNANYPWLILVPRRDGAVEIVDLTDEDQQQLIREIALASTVLKTATQCEKLNVAAIGNVVPQLHLHVVGRRQSDPAWPKPVWGAAPALSYDLRMRDEFVVALRKRLNLTTE